jgi:NitT/TauT family transport system permease protein
MAKGATRLLPIAGFGVLLASWQLAVSLSPSPVLPSPLATVAGISELASRGLLLKHVVASLFRVTWGYLGAVVIAVPLGLVLGWTRRGERALNPLIQIFRPISPLA